MGQAVIVMPYFSDHARIRGFFDAVLEGFEGQTDPVGCRNPILLPIAVSPP
jgi:hypothetical protein